ncbi:MAG: hypothetical protein ACK5YG_00365 [Alphaproteobacteria bacterium]
MSSGAGKKVSFVAGLTLVVAGAFDLYAGLMSFGLSEGALVEVSRSFMLVFPGYVFLAYSLHPSLRLSSNALRDEAVRDAVAVTAEPWTGPMPENVIVFPQRPIGRGPTPPGYRSYR